jgi:5,10-methylenetetrahydromethanopterin reductase
MIPFGISFDGFIPIAEAVETAKLAEACGARSFWVAEHLGFRESFLTSLALAQATKAARVFPTSVSPYLRHPMPTAMAFASLAELLPDRVGVAIGVGNPMFLKESGLTVEKPVKAIRDYVAALRSLLSGEPVNESGLTFRLDGARLGFKPDPLPPIYLAPMGPQMLRLAGRIADGLVLSAGLTAAYAKQSLDSAADAARENGRDPSALRKTSYIYFIAGGETKERNVKVRQKLAFLFRNQNIADNLRSSGLRIDHEGIMAAVARRDQAQAMALVPNEAVELFSVAGDAAECRRRLQAYADAGLDEVVLSLIGNVEDRMRSMQIVKTL